MYDESYLIILVFFMTPRAAEMYTATWSAKGSYVLILYQALVPLVVGKTQ